jgi:LmbE family N-acetylglucosaminyl deacetylase
VIYIIEPHPDDAFMSLHAHITTLWANQPKTIVTVTGIEERTKEAQSYARSVGCKHVTLGFADGDWLDVDNIPPFESWGLQLEECDSLVFPLGIRHPDHKKIAAMTLKGSFSYLDAYYAQGEMNDELCNKINRATVISALWANESKRYYLSRFPSQAIRFMLAQPNYPPRFELVVKARTC